MCRRTVIFVFLVLAVGMADSASAFYLKVDFAYPEMVAGDPCFVARFDLTAKDGWFPWADPSFKDCWRHDRTWCATYPDVGELPGGVNGTGINFQVDSGWTDSGVLAEGGKRFAAYGMHPVTDGGYATGHPLAEPIANSGMSTFDRADKRAVVLIIKGLGPGTYYLESYHNCAWDVNDPNYNNPGDNLYYNVPDINMGKIWIRGPDVNQVVTPEDFPIQREQVDANLVLVTAVFTKTDVCDCNVAFMPGPGGKVMVNAFILSTGKWYAREPDPQNEAINVCPGSSLCWTSDETVEFYDVYIGTAWADVNDANTSTSGIYKDRLEGTCYTPEGLQLGTTYYWRIDSISDVNLWKGEVWSFTTNDGNAYDPYPSDGAKKIPLDINSLSWTVGCSAATHDVFFGTSAADVNSATTSSHPNVTYTPGTAPGSYNPPGPLAYATYYYWRVDEVGSGGQRWHGKVWQFKTKAEISDPSLLVRYQFDELPPSSTAFDSSGNEFTGDIGGDPNDWDPDGGRFGGCRIFGGRCTLPADVPKTITSAITICMWLKDLPTSSDPGWNNLVLDASSSIVDWRMRVMVPSNQGSSGDWPGYILWRAGMEPNDRLSWDLNGIKIEDLDDWHHWVFIKDEIAQTLKIYFDGVLGASATGTTISNLASMYPNNILICGNQGGAGGGSATVDDFRIYSRALSEQEVLEVLRGDDLWSAWLPQPLDGAVDAPPDVNLTWKPGDYAVQHKVFFGLDWNDVNDMTDPCATLAVGSEKYDPGWLEFSQTYYWRVDEVNGPNTWKGPVWRFKVADFIMLDDFEGYNTSGNRVYNTWCDQRCQWFEETGSWLTLSKAPSYPVHGGDQSVEYWYNCNDPYAVYYYAEAWLPLSSVGFTNWTSVDVRLLTLFFYGDPINAATSTEQMYVGVKDTDGLYGEMRYGDHSGESLTDVQVAEWQRWDIPFVWFTDSNSAAPNDVNFASMETVHIGFGNRRNPVAGGEGWVYFDDIRLNMPICKAEYGPTGDLDGDCFVGVGDIGALGGQWLRGDVNLNPVTPPSDANLVARWELDGDATDSSVNGYDGVAEGAYNWVTGKVGSGAIDLSGGWVVVDDNGVTPKLRMKEKVSVMAWIYLDAEPSGTSRVVIKGENDEETFGLEVGGDGAGFLFRDSNGQGPYSVNSDELPVNEWVHLAGTYDGNEQLIYVNGVVEDSESIGSIELFTDPNDGLGIGGRYGDTGNRFNGTIDDVRVYDRAVSAAEIGYLAAGPTGMVYLQSEANLYSGESPEVINFKDFAKLFDYWGDEQLWPPSSAP